MAVAEGLYSDIRRLNRLLIFTESSFDDFDSLPEDEKTFWYDYSAGIPAKLKKLNLFIRPFEDFCRTCIITDKEIETLVQTDLEKYCRDLAISSLPLKKKANSRQKPRQEENSLKKLVKDWRRFALELNYLIPVSLKREAMS